VPNTAYKNDPRILFGRHLAEFRKLKGLSQERLAAECGFSRSYMRNIEHGTVNISLISVCRLAKTLNVHPKELMNFNFDPEDFD
jgi:transcriptional regulator with XRE-family HTH domain